MQVVGYFGGAAVVILSLSRWLGGIWSKRIIQNEKARIDIELEIEKVRLLE